MATEGAKTRPPTDEGGSGVNDTQVLVASAKISSARGFVCGEYTVASPETAPMRRNEWQRMESKRQRGEVDERGHDINLPTCEAAAEPRQLLQ